MRKDIMLRAPNEELTKEKIDKINMELEEYKKQIRHSSLFYQALLISLYVVILSIFLEIIDYSLGIYNVNKFKVMTIKLVFIGLLLLITFFKYVGYYQLEGKPGFYITSEYLKEYKKNKKQNQKEIIKESLK